MPQTFTITRDSAAQVTGGPEQTWYRIGNSVRATILGGSYTLEGLVESREALADLGRTIQKYLIENPPEPE